MEGRSTPSVWQQGRRQYYVTFEMATQKPSGQSVLPVLKAFKITGDVVDERKFLPRSKEAGPYYYYAGSVQRSVRYTWAAAVCCGPVLRRGGLWLLHVIALACVRAGAHVHVDHACAWARMLARLPIATRLLTCALRHPWRMGGRLHSRTQARIISLGFGCWVWGSER